MTPEFILSLLSLAVGHGVAVFMVSRLNVRAKEATEPADVDMEQLDILDALAVRDQVLAETATNNGAWMAKAAAALMEVPDGQEGTGEDFRLRIIESGVPMPLHHNAWGALFGAMSRKGILVKTGEFRPMRERKSHGRATPVYRKHAVVHEAAA